MKKKKKKKKKKKVSSSPSSFAYVCVLCVCVCVCARVCCACFCFAEWFKIDSWDFFFLTKDKILHNLDLKLDSMCDFRVTFCCFTKAKYQLGPLPDFL
jgi:hypothetical protein